MLEGDDSFLAEASSHLAALRAHAERYAAESRAAVAAEARMHAVRSSSDPQRQTKPQRSAAAAAERRCCPLHAVVEASLHNGCLERRW